MISPARATALLAFGFVVGFLAPAWSGDAETRTKFLLEKILRADAIVVGTVIEVQENRYVLSLYGKDAADKPPAMAKRIHIASVRAGRVLKSDGEGLVNKADASNPVAWVHVAFYTQQGIEFDRWLPTAKPGENKIWFLRRDLILTGERFIDYALPAEEATIEEIAAIVEILEKEGGGTHR